MHILLDTNVLIDFVKNGNDEHFIEQIIRLIEGDAIQLLVPETLLNEWNEKRKKTLDYISKNFSATAIFSALEVTGPLLKDNYALAEERAAYIDKFLCKGIKIKTPPKVKVDMVDRSIIHKAPFHDGKTKSINDALIYFTSIYFLQYKKILRFAFVTKDSADFGSQDNKNEILHKDLEVVGMEILYFTSLYRFFDKFKDEFKISQPDKEGLYQLVIAKRGNKNILDHLYDVIKTYKSKINFLPTHILSRIEPFRIIEMHHDYSYHSGSTLVTNNQTLVDFFKGIDIRKLRFKKSSEFSNSKKNLEKLTYILTALNENLVFSISYITQGQPIDIQHEINSQCPCALCKYQRLSFGGIISDVYNEIDELKKAFVLFQLGKFNESLKVYYNIYQNAIKEENKAVSYRILLILHWVTQYADYDVGESENKELIIKVKSIDREKAFLSALNGTKLEREIVLFLHGYTMIDHYKLEIKGHTEKIRHHYMSQLKASYSSNSNLQNLINAFLNFEMFTVYNGMAYTRYSDFKNICDDFAEGIFMCCALNQYQSSRIEYLDDYLLEKLLFYGEADKMIIHFNNYLKKQIRYQTENRNFEKLATNFLTSSKATINQFSDTKFWEGSASFYRIFWNLLVLLSIVEFDEAFIIICIKKIYNFLETLPKRETRQLHHLGSLINSKGKILKKEVLNRLFKCIIENPLLHNEDVFDNFSSIDGYRFKLDLTNTEFQNLSNLFFYKCEKCGEFHKEALFHLYSILPRKFQERVKKKVNEHLTNSFDLDLYYLSVLADIIDYRLFFNQYLGRFSSIKKSRNSYFLDGEIHDRHLSNLMNLVFKTKVNLPKTFKNQFNGYSDYYDWVINMKTFDYEKFKPIWIIQYPTKYYLEEAFSIEQVKTSVRKFLRVNNQPTLAFYFSQYVK